MKVPYELLGVATNAGWGSKDFRGRVEIEERVQLALQAVLPKVRELLLSGEAIEIALLAKGAVFETELARGETTPDESERMSRAGLEAAFDHAFPEESADGQRLG